MDRNRKIKHNGLSHKKGDRHHLQNICYSKWSQSPGWFLSPFLKSPLRLSILILTLLLIPTLGHAATYYWVGGSGDNISDNTNWNTSAAACNPGGGDAGVGEPSSNDIITFVSNCTNDATIDAALDVRGVSIQSGYTGTITQAAGVTVEIGVTGWTQVAGVFSGGDSLIDIQAGDFNITGGSFTTSTGGMDVRRNFTVGASATFTNTGNTLTFDSISGVDDTTVSCTGALNGDIVINKDSGNATFTLNSGCTLNLGANPTTDAYGDFQNDGIITISSGTWTLNAVDSDGKDITNNGTITHSGTGWILNNLSLTNNVGGLITYAGTAVTLERNFHQLGTFNLTGKTVTFNATSGNDDSDIDCTGSLGGTVVVNKPSGSDTFSVDAGCSIDLGTNPSSTFAGGVVNDGTIVISSGTWTVSGKTTSDADIVNNGTVTHSGTGWAINYMGLINNSGATITYAGTSMSVTRDFVQDGTFDLTGITVTLNDNNHSFDDAPIQCASPIEGNIIIDKTNGGAVTTLSDNCTIQGNFTRTDGVISSPAAAYTLTVQGNIVIDTTDTTGGSNFTLSLGGGNNQTLSLNAGDFDGVLDINKSGGVADLSTTWTNSNENVVITEGTLDLNNQTLTLNGGGTLTVQDGGNLQIDGGETYPNPTFNAGSTLTYDGSTQTISLPPVTIVNLAFNEAVGGQTYTLPDSNLSLNGVLTVTDGIVVMDDDKSLTLNDTGATGTALTIATNGTLNNTGTGDLSLGGGVSISGSITFDSSDNGGNGISISSTGGKRTWTNTGGTISMTDVTVSNQASTTGITTSSSTNGGSNSNWLFPGGSLTSTSVTPASLVESTTNNNTIVFTTTNDIATDGKVQIVYPIGFDVSGVTTATSSTDIDGTLTTAIGGQTITITRSGASTVVSGGSTIDDLILNNIVNPSSGATGTFTINILDTNDNVIDTGTASSITIVSGSSSSTTTLIDSLGSSTSTYTVGSSTTGKVYIQVTDTDENSLPGSIETVQVTLSSALTSDQETITLTETGINTGIFNNLSTGLTLEADNPSSLGNNILETRSLDTLTASYTDNDDGSDTSSDQATIEDIGGTFSILLDMSKGSLSRGDLLEGNLSITNLKNTTIENTDIVLNLPQGVSYIEGSSSVTKGNVSISNISRNNRDTLLTIPSINANENIEVSFKLIIGSHVHDGEILDITVYTDNG